MLREISEHLRYERARKEFFLLRDMGYSETMASGLCEFNSIPSKYIKRAAFSYRIENGDRTERELVKGLKKEKMMTGEIFHLLMQNKDLFRIRESELARVLGGEPQGYQLYSPSGKRPTVVTRFLVGRLIRRYKSMEDIDLSYFDAFTASL